MLTRWFWILESHLLDFLKEDHSPTLNEVSNWHSGIDSFHGAHVIPVVKHIGNNKLLCYYSYTLLMHTSIKTVF